MEKIRRTYTSLLAVGIAVLLLVASDWAKASTKSLDNSNLKEYYKQENIPRKAQQCINCHLKLNPGIVADWFNSKHARESVT
jgi:hypothetical protein